jgi:hypothetical protein
MRAKSSKKPAACQVKCPRSVFETSCLNSLLPDVLYASERSSTTSHQRVLERGEGVSRADRPALSCESQMVPVGIDNVLRLQLIYDDALNPDRSC